MLTGNYGQVNLYHNLDGEERARRETASFKYYVADNGSMSGYQGIAQPDIDAGQLRTLLNVIMKTGRPVIEPETPPQSAAQNKAQLPQPRAAIAGNISQLPGGYSVLIMVLAAMGYVIARRNGQRWSATHCKTSIAV